MPRYQFCRVAYEIPEEQALERFAEVAQQIRGEHWRYICWALEEWPAAYTGQLPTLPHLASAEEPYDAAESFMVFDEGPLRRAQEAGWRHRGRVWTNPSSGLMEEGAVYAGFSPGEFGRIRCQWLHFHLAGQVVTALVPFDFTLVPAEALVHRWVTNEPFPEMP